LKASSFLHVKYYVCANQLPEDSILFIYNYFTLCADQQKNSRLIQAKDSLIKAVYYSVLAKDYSLLLHKCVGGGIYFDVSECKVLVGKNKPI
jgi:hypothetical protein